MSTSPEFGDTFIKEVASIGESVEKWPEWKKQGWAILDLKQTPDCFEAEDTSKTQCAGEEGEKLNL